MKCLAVTDTGRQTVEIWSNGRQTEFRVRGATHAWWHRERLVTGYVWDAIAAACVAVPGSQPGSVLMLGLGGGTSLRALRALCPAVRICAVEFDPGMIGLARRHMELDRLDLEIHVADAYQWLDANPLRKFDVVLDDVYLALADRVARPGWSDGHLAKLRRALAPGGLVAANLVTGRGHRAMQSALRRSFAAAFPVVRSLTMPLSQNEVLVGGGRVAGQADLRWLGGNFSNPHDRRLWQGLAARRLPAGRDGCPC
jgi:predicted O-methyltransferase YrrM